MSESEGEGDGMYERWVVDLEGLALDTLDELAVDEPVIWQWNQHEAQRHRNRRYAEGAGAEHTIPMAVRTSLHWGAKSAV